ncbi:hypothetical protein QQ045_013482 [Rhodiola kirilowii]
MGLIRTQRSQSFRCFFWGHRHQSIILPLIFLVLSSSTHFRLMAEGKLVSIRIQTLSQHFYQTPCVHRLNQIFKFAARVKPSYNEADQKTRSETRAQMIGSRPPRCQYRCRGCGPCEAVQVPVNPQLHGRRSARSNFYKTHEIEYSRGDDVTNYKPMGWKCKCGNLFFNP